MMKKELNCDDVKVIVIGGLVKLIVLEMKSIDYVDGFLILEGLRIIYEKN